MLVLIADVDLDFRRSFARFLLAHQVAVEEFASLPALDRVLDTGKPAIVVLDLELGVRMGIGYLHHLLRARSCPSVVLSARHDPNDRAAILQLGADAYLDKGVRHSTVLTTLRHLAATRDEPRAAGEWRLEEAERTLVGPGEVALALTSAEYDLFRVLHDKQGRTVGRAELFATVFGRSFNPLDRAVDTVVAKLRAKLAEAGARRPLILTIRAGGYLFTGFPAPGASRRDSTLPGRDAKGVHA